MPARRAHGLVEDSAHRHTHHADRLCSISPLQGAGEDVVEHLQHVVIVADLALACRVPVVGRSAGNLLPHLAEIHVDARIALDQLLELLQDRNQFLGVGVNAVHLVLEPLRVHTIDCGEVCTRPVGMLGSRSSELSGWASVRLAVPAERRYGVVEADIIQVRDFLEVAPALDIAICVS